jgi:ubiquinone/menaquinone biosynthesis C-methylase UbiE
MARQAAQDVVAIYTRWAFIYDAFAWLTELRSLAAAIAKSGLRDGEAVLEVAVGTGVGFRQLLQANPSGRNVGVDLTDAMLRRARTKAQRTHIPFELSIGDARSLGFADESFDLVMNNNMFGLVPEADFLPILREMRRVLRRGGRLVVVTMQRPKGWLADLFYEVATVRLGGWRDIAIVPFVSSAGFELVEREIVNQLGIPSEVLVARRES